MGLTITDLFILGLYGLVLIQTLIAIASITVVGTLVAKAGWRWHHMVYSYELGLLLLYTHFYLHGPPPVSPAMGNLVYWAALLGTAPANVAPLVIEWQHLAALRKRRTRHLSMTVIIVGAWVVSGLITGGLCWLLYYFEYCLTQLISAV